MSSVSRKIYRVDPVIQAYAKTPSRRFEDLAKRYKAITTSKRFQSAFPRYGAVSLVKSSGGGSYAYLTGDHSQGRVISLGANRDEAVLLHEIAHFVAYRHGERYGCEEGHGPGFALALLNVVRVCQGAEAEKALRHMYKALGIRVHKAGSKRGVIARTQGDAPERAAAIIADVVGAKERFANKRAMARAMVRERGEGIYRESTPSFIDGYKSTCLQCGNQGRVNESRRTRTQIRWYAQCDACGFGQLVTLPR